MVDALKDPRTKVARSIELSNKVSKAFHSRARLAQERFTGRAQKVLTTLGTDPSAVLRLAQLGPSPASRRAPDPE